MSKVTTIFISILLILAAAIIHYFVEVTARVDEEWIGFFSGMCFGTGIVLPLTLLKKKKNT